MEWKESKKKKEKKKKKTENKIHRGCRLQKNGQVAVKQPP